MSNQDERGNPPKPEHPNPSRNNPFVNPQTPSATNPWANVNSPATPQNPRPQGPPQGPPPGHNYPMAPVPPAAAKKSPVGILMAIIALLLAAILAVLAWFYFSNQSSGDNNAAAEAQPTLSVTPAPEEENVAAVTTVTTVVPPPAEAERDSSRITTSITPTTSVAGGIGAAARADGVTERGWADNGVVNCGSGETLIYAARGNSAWVTVCSGGGGQTYRSDVFGGTLIAPVVTSQSNPASGYFTVDASPATIVVRGAGLTVEQNGQVISSADLPVAWVFD